MSGMIERFPGRPVLPGLHGVAGLHGIRVEEPPADGVYALRAELPGVAPGEDVEITVSEGVLPLGAKGDEATAAYKDGVLTITVPVPQEKTGARTIQVRTG
ncbi:Hsp20 family protein [Streptomyces roseirectus]|uniref:Hsp20 family protein n=1 Tax=Streptomyces roseirectus TaxID=2768066 RepID=A0A7H0I687_9ACTN|nr:Hsp20 family protein [Streptomyces roseirectus]QNP68303.1 Hsp20 family protein [Streptomyces roseirectus]